MSPTSYQAAPPRGTVDSRTCGPPQALPSFGGQTLSTLPGEPGVPAAAKPRLVVAKLGPVGVVGRVAGGLAAAVASGPVAADEDVRPGIGMLSRPDDPLFDVSRQIVDPRPGNALRVGAARRALVELLDVRF